MRRTNPKFAINDFPQQIFPNLLFPKFTSVSQNTLANFAATSTSCPAGSLRLSGFDALERLNLAQYLGMDLVAVVDVEMKNGGVAGEIEIRELAAKARLGRERRTPAAGLVVVDGPPDIGGNRLGPIGSERHHEVDRNVADLKRTRDFDRVVSSLRVAHEDKGTDIAGGPVPQDIGDGRRPIQVPAHFRLDAPRPEFVGEAVQARREQVEPAAQQEHPGFGRECTVAPQQGNGRDGSDPPRGRSRTEWSRASGMRTARMPKLKGAITHRREIVE